MTQNSSIWCWKLWLVSSLAICGAITSSENCTFAQITPDGTLGAESSVVIPIDPLTNQIEGGANRGANLFHSFEQFSVPANGETRFNNDLIIQNVIGRVTGSSASSIDGLIKTNGTANLFLINPNGIIFGPNASLEIGGSFLASTASSLNFADGTQFSATAPQTSPLLTVSVPIGLQFGPTPGSIINRSQASRAVNSLESPAGLQVQTGKTLALVGGNVLLEGGNITAAGGLVELGSVAGNSLVSLNPTEKGWALSYESVHNFQNIQLTPPANFNESGIPSYVDVSGEGGGKIQLQGRLIKLTNSSLIADTTGGLQPGNLSLTGSESVELIGNATILATLTRSAGDAGDININTRQLVVQDGAQVFTLTDGRGLGGKLTVNASESVKVIGSYPSPFSNRYSPSSLLSSTVDEGNAGDLTINTRILLIQDGARVSTEPSQTFDSISGQIIPPTGRGGNLTVNASDSIELSGTRPDGTPSGLSGITQGSGNSGDLSLTTGNLIVQDGAIVTVSSEGTGDAGNLQVQARSIRLNNEGKLTATTESGKGGGNIRLQDLGSLLLRGKSEISTNAGGSGNGGNITINTDILATLENSDIAANAVEGRGGNIQIRTQGFIVSPDSDIVASSERGIDGVVEINTPDVDPSQGLVNLPAELVDVTGLIAQSCPTGGGNVAKSSEFIVTGRGGLPPTPREATRSDPALADLGTPVKGEENRAIAATSSNPTGSEPAPIVEATGWVIGSKGEVILTAQAPTVTLYIPWLSPTTCDAS